MTEGVDYSHTASSDWNGLAATLAANGKFIAGRYAVSDKSPSGCGITGPEYTALMAHGIDLFLYYEEDEAWMLGGFSAGVRAANTARSNLLAAGMPIGCAIYYSHDIDPEPHHFSAIDDCLRGAASVTGIASVGFYGGWLGIDHVAAAGTARWFTQTSAWEYGRGVHPAANLYQYAYNASYYGTACDLVRSVTPLYGGASETLAGATTPPPVITTPPEPEPEPPPPWRRPANAGMYRLRPRCYLSDQSGALGDEISDLVADGLVAVDLEAEVPSTFTAHLIDPDVVPAWSWLRVFMAMSWFTADGTATVDEPVGHFQVMPPAVRHTAAQGLGAIDGRDACWLLKQRCLPNALNYAVGANVVESVRALLTAAGCTRIHLPARSNTFTKKRSYEAGTPTLDVINDLFYRIAYYPLWFDREGYATSRRTTPRTKTAPRRTFASDEGDIVDVVDLETDVERLVNRVTVIADDPKRDAPIVVTTSNNRHDSPASIGNLGFVKSKVITASNVDTIAEATALANDELEKGASVVTRVALATIPDPAFAFHETIRLDIKRDDGERVVADGNWRWDQLTLGLMPNQQPQRWRFSRIFPWSDS